MTKVFPGAAQIGVVVGGDVNDPAPDLSGNFKIWSPTEHNPNNFPKDALPFTTILEPATKASQSEFGGVPDPSSMVMTLKTTGGFPVAIGQFRDFVNPNKAVGGNNNAMMRGLSVYGVWDQGLGMMRPAKVVEKNEGGVPVRRRESPQEYRPSDIQGLPNHAALYNMAGHRWPQMQNIETATQHFSQVISSSMIGQMAGQVSSLAGMLKGLNSRQKKRIKDNVPEEIYDAFESMVHMMPEIDGGSSFVSDFRADPDTYSEKAVDLLCQCTTMADLQESLNMLETDDSFRGLENLEDVEFEIEGPFGNTVVTLSGTGQASSRQSQGFQQAMQTFSSFLASASSAMSANKGSNLFGGSSKTITDMIQRVAPETQQVVKSALERVNQGSAKDHGELTNLFQTGGAKALTQTILSGVAKGSGSGGGNPGGIPSVGAPSSPPAVHSVNGKWGGVLLTGEDLYFEKANTTLISETLQDAIVELDYKIGSGGGDSANLISFMANTNNTLANINTRILSTATPTQARAMSSDTVVLTPKSLSDALQRATVTPTANVVTLDLNARANYTVQISANTELANPSAVMTARSGTLVIDCGTNNHGFNLTYGNAWRWEDGQRPNLPSSRYSYLFYYTHSASIIVARLLGNVAA